jgi:hypothetical protein
MKRSDLFIKLTSVVLFLGIVGYFGFYIYGALSDPTRMALAVSFSVDEIAFADGYIVRDEALVPGGGSMSVPAVSDGKRVPLGALVATVYPGETSLAGASELREISSRITRLEAAENTAPKDAERARADSVLMLSAALKTRSLENLEELSFAAESLVLGAVSKDNIPSELTELRERKRRIESGFTPGTPAYAQQSGIFSASSDGFESVSFESIKGVGLRELTELFRAPGATNAVGKLVFGTKWYFAAILDSPDAFRLAVGQTVTVAITRPSNLRFTMSVETVGRDESGQCAVVFSCDSGLADVAPLRVVSTEITLTESTGIYVPVEAIRLEEDNREFVYIRSGGRAERVAVTLLREYGDGYVVEPTGTNAAALREGIEIIVRANDLYDGKLMN